MNTLCATREREGEEFLKNSHHEKGITTSSPSPLLVLCEPIMNNNTVNPSFFGCDYHIMTWCYYSLFSKRLLF